MGSSSPTVGTPFTRGLAVAGIVLGMIGLLALGLLAWWNYDGWKKGRDKYPLLAWYVAWFVIIGVIGVLVTLLIGGWQRVSADGGIGTAVMFVGAFLATDVTYYFNEVKADVPTLKTARGQAPTS
jgi:H+/Cl- antiporter ClcA